MEHDGLIVGAPLESALSQADFEPSKQIVSICEGHLSNDNSLSQVCAIENVMVGEVLYGSAEHGRDVFIHPHSLMGKSFPTLDEAYDFYNEYAQRNGFGICNSSSILSRETRKVIRKEFVCNKEGQKSVKASINQQQKQRRKLCTCCLAKMEVGLKSEEARKLILDLHEAELTPSQITKTVNSLSSNLHEDISANQYQCIPRRSF